MRNGQIDHPLDQIIPLPEFHELHLPDGQVLQFEWDEWKEQRNIREHHVPFRLAMRVFADEQRLILEDNSSEKEDRWDVIGHVQTRRGRFLFVVYTERYYTRRGPSYRLISARKASDEEVRLYRESHY